MDAALPGAAPSVRVGRIIGYGLDGVPVVDFPGNTRGPVNARILSAVGTVRPVPLPRDTDVVLVFDSGDLSRPIILGALGDASSPGTGIAATAVLSRPLEGDTLELLGRKQITLRCGRSSIEMHADGRIVIKGTRLVSRASEVNKIKGAVVALN
ncbi:MAG: DUF6484 domain-containing protein [Rubrivivax sp.]|nr:DUF6484 domain-containing protein [Rubrivivax sp.]